MLKLYVARFLLKLFYVFGVKQNKIFFSSYEGATISCNPKYIYRELRKIYGDKLLYVWELNSCNCDDVISVKHNSISYMYHVMTSKFIISNTGITACFPIRKQQISINTWHGAGCYKKVGVDLAETNLRQYKIRRHYDEKNITYYLSGCDAWTRVFSEAVLSNPKKFLPVGSPRIDILFNGISDEFYNTIRTKIGIKSRIVLYAPTYRGERDTPEDSKCPINVNALLNALSERFGGEWVFAYRCHYATASTFHTIKNTVDLSWYDDMQELLAVSDILISDYSSSIWDYSFTMKPCFLYCYDLDNYVAERDFYMPIKEWHFPVSENMDELIEQIMNFDESSFKEGMLLHHKELGSFENGDATKKVLEIITKEFKFHEDNIF